MKILCIINTGKRHESIHPVGYILYQKDDSIILKNTIIKDLEDSIKLLKESMIFNNQYISLSTVYVIGYLLLVIVLGKEYASSH